MSDHATSLSPELRSITHPLKDGSRTKACQIPLLRPAIFLGATIKAPVPHIANFYEGWIDGEKRLQRFFAHMGTVELESTLRQHLRATLNPQLHYGPTLHDLAELGRIAGSHRVAG